MDDILTNLRKKKPVQGTRLLDFSQNPVNKFVAKQPQRQATVAVKTGTAPQVRKKNAEVAAKTIVLPDGTPVPRPKDDDDAGWAKIADLDAAAMERMAVASVKSGLHGDSQALNLSMNGGDPNARPFGMAKGTETPSRIMPPARGLTEMGNMVMDSMTSAGSNLTQNPVGKFVGGHSAGLLGGILQAPFTVAGGAAQFFDPQSTPQMRAAGPLEAFGEIAGGKTIEAGLPALLKLFGKGGKPVVNAGDDILSQMVAKSREVPQALPGRSSIPEPTIPKSQQILNAHDLELAQIDQAIKQAKGPASKDILQQKRREMVKNFRESYAQATAAESGQTVKLPPDTGRSGPAQVPALPQRGTQPPTRTIPTTEPRVPVKALPKRSDVPDVVAEGKARLQDIEASQGGIMRRAEAQRKAERAARGTSEVQPVTAVGGQQVTGPVRMSQSTKKPSYLDPADVTEFQKFADVGDEVKQAAEVVRRATKLVKKYQGNPEALDEILTMANKRIEENPLRGGTRATDLTSQLAQSIENLGGTVPVKLKVKAGGLAKEPVKATVPVAVPKTPVLTQTAPAVNKAPVVKAQVSEPVAPAVTKPAAVPVKEAVKAVAPVVETPKPLVSVVENKATSPGRSKTVTNVSDFGEEIAGARKHTAVPLGPRTAKAAVEEGPKGWRSRYTIFENANSADKGTFSIGDKRTKSRYGGNSLATTKKFASAEEAEKALPLLEVSRNHNVYGLKDGTFGIHRKLGDNRPLVKGGFATREEALKYMALNPEEIINHKFEAFRKPYLTKIERQGRNVRSADVSPEEFQKTFSFRGGQFGKWQSNPDGQISLNHAYDGLHDMADAIGIDLKHISLDKDLGIAFGARGHGSVGGQGAAAAHYERGQRVINLTKMNGAGTLAHEWAHALDHSIGKVVKSDAYATGLGYRKHPVPEVNDAIRKVVRTLTTSETARPVSDGSGMMDAFKKSAENAMSDLRSQLLYDETKYRTRGRKPASPEIMAEFDKLAKRVIEGDFGGKATFESKSRYSYSNETREVFNHLDALYKKAKGRTIYVQGDYSIGNKLNSLRRQFEAAESRIAKATAGESEVIGKRSNFFREAAEMDTKRASKYYSTDEEMWARAFEAYVSDKLKAKGITSQYLVHSTENGPYRAMGIGSPYPEGAEREAINQAFDNLFDVMGWRKPGENFATGPSVGPPKVQEARVPTRRGGMPRPRFKGGSRGSTNMFDPYQIDYALNAAAKAGVKGKAAVLDWISKNADVSGDMSGWSQAYDSWATTAGKAGVRGAKGQQKEETPKVPIIKRVGQEVAGLGRTLQATGDVSGSRNVKMLGAAHPGLKLKTEAASYKGMVKPQLAKDMANEIQSATGSKKKLYDAISWDRMEGIGESAETFSSGIEKVPIIGKTQGAFERNFSMKTNGMRKAVADHWLKVKPNMTDAEIESLGTAIDLLSSKGFKATGSTVEKALNSAFFSPKAQFAKVRAPIGMADELIKSAKARKMTPAAQLYTRAYASHIGTGMLTMYLAAQAGHKVSLDPNNSDFGKIIVGNRRFDIWQGEGGLARIFVKALSRGYAGKSYDLTGDLGRWVRYKASPNVNLALSLATGEDAVGKPQTPVQAGISHVLPLYWKDLAEGGPEEDKAVKIIAAILGATGGVTSQYREGQGGSSGRKG